MTNATSTAASKLSREDHEKWFRDLIAYGQAFLVEMPDGRARYVSHSEARQQTK